MSLVALLMCITGVAVNIFFTIRREKNKEGDQGGIRAKMASWSEKKRFKECKDDWLENLRKYDDPDVDLKDIW